MYFILTALQRICFAAMAFCVIGLYFGLTDRFDQLSKMMAGGGALVAVVTGAICYFFGDE